MRLNLGSSAYSDGLIFVQIFIQIFMQKFAKNRRMGSRLQSDRNDWER